MNDQLNTLPGHSQMAQEDGTTKTRVQFKLVDCLFRVNRSKEEQNNSASTRTTPSDECIGTSSLKKICLRDENLDFGEKRENNFKEILENQTQSVRRFQQSIIRNKEGREEDNAIGEQKPDSLLSHIDPKKGDLTCSGTEVVYQKKKRKRKGKGYTAE